MRPSKNVQRYSKISKRSAQSFLFRSSLVQSTTFFSCSKVTKIKMVVGCSLIQAGTQPLKTNIGPSLRNEFLITSSVDYVTEIIRHEVGGFNDVRTRDPDPDAFMIRLWMGGQQLSGQVQGINLPSARRPESIPLWLRFPGMDTRQRRAYR